MNGKPPSAQRRWLTETLGEVLYPDQDAQSCAGLYHHNCDAGSLTHKQFLLSFGAWISPMSGNSSVRSRSELFHFAFRSFGTRASGSAGFSSAVIVSWL